MIQEIFIGSFITTKLSGRVEIIDDPKQYDNYKKLGLGFIFEKSEAKTAKKMSFPREVRTAEEKLENKTKAEIAEMLDVKGIDYDIKMPKKLLIELLNDRDNTGDE